MDKVNSAESLRGLACLAVVFSHLLGTFFPQLHNFYESSLPKYEIADSIYNSPFAFFYSGTGAVFVFFVLSGYILTLVSLKGENKLTRFKVSIVKRYPRLALPATFSCLLMYFALQIDVDMSKVSEWTQTLKLENPSFFSALYGGAISAFFGGGSKFNPALWTMRIELIGSFFIYTLCVLQDKKKLKLMVLLLILGFISFTSLLTMLGFISFLIGHYLYFFKSRIPEPFIISLFVFGLYLCGAHNTSSSYKLFSYFLSDKTYTFLNFSGGVFIVFAVLNSCLINKMLDKPIFISLGKMSFTIYVIHFTLIYLISIPVLNVLIKFFSFEYAAITSCLISLPVILLLSKYLNKYVDDMAINFSNLISRKIIK
ncbi:acyltransferase [Acinetobacter baumannii]|uniref:acyltransferase family protein n=1 Tax=Acinetobacter baumannii TaxID=470 RepID=UPI0010C7EF99|nr:acyltransferase [Acinetobacter baumannii]NDW80053.1 acyltransferase [Acinetobacter baumannii]NDW97824.1 acyltransferase [Acinetobacter baumannii]QCP22440.1 acyltransferase [Acinetobacter baumannii]